MDTNLASMIAGGIVLSILGIIRALNASIEDRSARLGKGLFVLGIGMVAWSRIMTPAGLMISDIPQAFLIAVVALVK
ncbi:hypothetical protein N9747_10780 [Planktomarina sp.]|nr:hypothetical protein [Planktomarina sp.]